jgi:hypothetical protein
VIRIPYDQAEEFLSKYRKQQQDATKIELFDQRKGVDHERKGMDHERKGMEVSGGTDRTRLVPGIVRGGGRRQDKQSPVGDSTGNYTARAPAEIRIVPQDHNRLKSHDFAKQPSYHQGVAMMPSTRFVHPANTLLSMPLQSGATYRPAEVKPMSHVGLPIALPSRFDHEPKLLHAPQLHALPGLDIYSEIDNTLQRIVSRAFN